jgi:hypothetical protein
MDLLFTLEILAQVGACPNHVQNTSKMTNDVLLLGHHLSRQVWMSKSSWRPNPYKLVHLGLWEQPTFNQMPKLHIDSVFDDPYMDEKII